MPVNADGAKQYCLSRYGERVVSVDSNAEVEFLYSEFFLKAGMSKFFVVLKNSSQAVEQNLTNANNLKKLTDSSTCYSFNSSSNHLTSIDCSTKLPYTICKVEMQSILPQLTLEDQKGISYFDAERICEKYDGHMLSLKDADEALSLFGFWFIQFSTKYLTLTGSMDSDL
uniref:C-type lectin domain-containing protein n=1 Tax=Syphacia muris TaxID=451379 RepID=A0A0N5AX13_9BILA